MAPKSRPPAALLERARRSGSPVIEDGTAWFAWEGDRPPALLGDFNGFETDLATVFQPAGLNLWAAGLDFVTDAYIEYVFQQGRRRLLDPLNPRRTPNGVGQTNNFFYMPQGRPTLLTLRQVGVRHGRLIRVDLDPEELLPGGSRQIMLYQPAGDQPCPLLVVYDGEDYFRRVKITTQVENLAAAGRIRPVALVMIPPHDPSRTLEYACSDITLAFLIHKVLPAARQRLRLSEPDTVPWGVLGASMGGLMALYTGLRLPQIFGRVLSQSGAYLSFGPPPIIYDLVQSQPTAPVRIWMDCGRYEQILLPGHSRMHDLLNGKGYDAAYRQFPAGHNYPAWRDDLHHGLEWLFAAV